MTEEAEQDLDDIPEDEPEEAAPARPKRKKRERGPRIPSYMLTPGEHQEWLRRNARSRRAVIATILAVTGILLAAALLLGFKDLLKGSDPYVPDKPPNGFGDVDPAMNDVYKAMYSAGEWLKQEDASNALLLFDTGRKRLNKLNALIERNPDGADLSEPKDWAEDMKDFAEDLQKKFDKNMNRDEQTQILVTAQYKAVLDKAMKKAQSDIVRVRVEGIRTAEGLIRKARAKAKETDNGLLLKEADAYENRLNDIKEKP